MIKRDEKETAPQECLHCGTRAPMKIVTAGYHEVEYGNGTPGEETDEDQYRWEILVCCSCHRPTLEQSFRTTFEQTLEEWPSHTEVLYPFERVKLTGLPKSVQTAYDAALKVQGVDPNAFAVLVGRTLEVICNDRNATGDSLYDKLQDLGNRGEIPGRLNEMAQGIRLLRNVGAHADLGDVRLQDVAILVDFCEVILEYVYRAPARLELLRKRLAKSKRTKV